jgi:hypothetical protein
MEVWIGGSSSFTQQLLLVLQDILAVVKRAFCSESNDS